MRQGYTLMELLVVIGVMMVVVGAGMGVFYQSLRGGSKVDFELFMDTSSRVVEASMADVIGFSRVMSVDDQDQESCLAAGAYGVLGSSLTAESAGDVTEYVLEDDYIASNSSRVSPEGLQIKALGFNWICVAGEKERLVISYTAQAEKEGQNVEVEKDYSFQVLLKNSGYY